MTAGLSLHLDRLRAWAAIVVLLSHWAYPRFTGERHLWIRELNLGSDAVVLFFVLSGFLVAYVAERDGGPTRFAFQRLTRLWSVALPALLLGLALDRLGAALWPAAYAGWWYAPMDAGDLLRGLSFSNEWGAAVRLGSNGPFWSLSYEAAFYLLFALWTWSAGTRRAALLAVAALLIGPRVLLLLPPWLMGVMCWRAVRDGRLPGPALGRALAWGAPAAYLLALAAGVPGVLAETTRGALGLPGLQVLRFSDEALWALVLGALVSAHLVGTAALATGIPRDRPLLRWLAGGSFSLYLVHYPVLQVLAPALGAPGGPGLDLLLLALTLAACLAFAAVFERTLPGQRRWLRGLARGTAQTSTGRRSWAPTSNTRL